MVDGADVNAFLVRAKGAFELRSLPARPGAKLKSRRDLIKSRRYLLKSRRDLIKSRRDLILFPAICPKRLALNKTNRTARYFLNRSDKFFGETNNDRGG